jgi:hypothetical protein
MKLVDVEQICRALADDLAGCLQRLARIATDSQQLAGRTGTNGLWLQGTNAAGLRPQ